MTTIERPADIHGSRRTPAGLYRLISSPVLRAVLGWDLARHDIRVVSRCPGTVCVEVGSGGGFYTSALLTHLGSDSTLIALDPSSRGLHSLRHQLDGRPGARMMYLTGDGCQLPLPDGKIDTLFYGYSLEEMPDPVGAIHEAHRVLRPGGELALFLWRPAINRHRRRPVIAVLDQLFERRHIATSPQNLRLIYRKHAGHDVAGPPVPHGEQTHATGRDS